MKLFDFLIIDGLIIIAALIWYRNRPKPRWLRIEIDAVKWVARLLRLIKRVKAIL